MLCLNEMMTAAPPLSNNRLLPYKHHSFIKDRFGVVLRAGSGSERQQCQRMVASEFVIQSDQSDTTIYETRNREGER